MRVPPSALKNEAVREGANELGTKLRGDLSRLMRVRRFVSLQHTIGCMACDAEGKVPCEHCSGTGKTSVVVNDVQQTCAACDGTGQVTCVECAGVGRVPNVNRKRIIIMLWVGGAAWLYVLFLLWGGDVAPELRANIAKGGGGHAVKVAAPMGGGHSIAPTSQQQAPGQVAAPTGQPGTIPQGGGGYAAPQGGGGYAAPQGGGGYAAPQGGGGYAAPQGGGGYSAPQGAYRR